MTDSANNNIKNPDRYQTAQEAFWAGQFGTDYIERNRGEETLARNLAFFSHALKRASKINSCCELGANIGLNLRSIRQLLPHAALSAVEINADAVSILHDWMQSTGGADSSYVDPRLLA
ncbi:hypothetical protein [Halochromatium salexigens]|uniref:hypothetical protein n=1 Tax=Halochromatium salexigens TaxID=49447 RepID=UPI0019125329|nr:hypothetical protein [Halochromatium salexigens]